MISLEAIRPLRGALALPAALALLLVLLPASARTQPRPEVVIRNDESGSKLVVDGEDFMVKGMNWGYIPIGENYMFNLWDQPDEIIVTALDREMSLLRDMGVNTVKLLSGVPPRWVRYIYETYGITTVLNHQMARYGYLLDGVWIPSVDYSDPRLREAVRDEIVAMVREFEDTPGVLMWLLGNENNYGLSWSSFEIEAIPQEDRQATMARYLYSMVEEITVAIKAVDPHRPVALANGDLQYIEIIAEECRSLDVFGTNVYRGMSASAGRTGLDRHGPLFDVVAHQMGIPVLYTEFGADAFNARTGQEDQLTQAKYLIGQWKELYEEAYGLGGAGNSVGGLVFQWSDGWWKYLQDDNLNIHDTNASWPNAAYPEDYVQGSNNMNEEWWGIVAKGPADYRRLYEVYPRAAYFALKRVFQLDPYAAGVDRQTIESHFAAIDPAAMTLEARGSTTALNVDQLKRVRLSGIRMEFETYNTGGTNITTPPATAPTTSYPAFQGFDHMQSFFFDVEAKPSENVRGFVSLSVLGNVPVNPIDEIFYENRGRPVLVQTEGGQLQLQDLERLKVYQASVSWDDRWFQLNAFYRTGHYHWAYEGDFFGLYREAYYGENIDIYNANTPIGVEIDLKRTLEGLTLAYGPELWWGANPAVMLKYNRTFGSIDATGILQEDIADQRGSGLANVARLQKNRKASVHLSTQRGPVGIEVGGIWSGSTKLDDPFDIYEERAGGAVLLRDSVQVADTFGGKVRLTYSRGKWNWYGQAAYMGLVADGGGPLQSQDFTGWQLKDSGSGNQSNVITGMTVNVGNYQIGPNFLYQKPLVGPIPEDPDNGFTSRVVGLGTGRDDPFSVRSNREMVAAEVVLTYDPNPATWLWRWDNDVREDAKLAWSLGFNYRDMKTTQDAYTAFLPDGVTRFALPGAAPGRGLWEANFRLVSRLGASSRLVAHAYVGRSEANAGATQQPADSPLNRTINRGGADARLATGPVGLEGAVKINDWGPYDYHRDFNLTFPLQLMGDVSYALGSPSWFFDVPDTKIGLRSTWRSLDEFSPRYCPDPPACAVGAAPGDNGTEWEIRTYLHVGIL